MKKTYLCYGTILIEVTSDRDLTDAEVEEQAKNQFFADIETYKRDEVAIEIFEEMDNIS